MFIYSLAQSQTKIIKIPLGTAFVIVDCFDSSVAEQDKDLYVRLYLNQTGAKEILLASYLPGSNKLKIEDPKQNGKIKVSATGKAVIDVAAITDKIGMNAFRCSSNSYNLDMPLIIKTTIHVYEPEKGTPKTDYYETDYPQIDKTKKNSGVLLTIISVGVVLLICGLVCYYVVLRKRRQFQKHATDLQYIDSKVEHATDLHYIDSKAEHPTGFQDINSKVEQATGLQDIDSKVKEDAEFQSNQQKWKNMPSIFSAWASLLTK